MSRNREDDNSSSMSSDSSSSDSDSGGLPVDHPYTLRELQQLARAYNTEHAPIPLKQTKAALTAVLIERGVLMPAGETSSPSDAEQVEFDEKGARLIGQLADIAAQRAVERLLALPKNTLSLSWAQ
jgi:hypothetical protein